MQNDALMHREGLKGLRTVSVTVQINTYNTLILIQINVHSAFIYFFLIQEEDLWQCVIHLVVFLQQDLFYRKYLKSVLIDPYPDICL